MKAPLNAGMKKILVAKKEDITQSDKFIGQVEPAKKSNALLNWTIFLMITAIIYAIFYFVPFGNIWHSLPTMSGLQVLFFSLALAFTWVEVLRWGSVKPFNCVKCLTGWFALTLAFLFHAEFWQFYLVGGLFVGAMYSAIKMRLF